MTQFQSRILHGFRGRIDSHGGFRAAVRAIGLLDLLDAGLRVVWYRLGSLFWRLLPAHRSGDYGLVEAMCVPAYDHWLRYQIVIEAISALQLQSPLQVLEVGSGVAGISMFLKPGSAQVCLTDMTEANVIPRYCANTRYVRSDACCLPFADDSFPVVISVDTLEHIARPARTAFLSELKRVAKEAVILTCPLDSQDGQFQAEKCDSHLQKSLGSQKKRIPGWLDEHLQQGHPILEEVSHEFEGARIDGYQNCAHWMRMLPLLGRRFLWIFSGFFYVLAMKKTDRLPPFYRGLIVWQKNSALKTTSETSGKSNGQ